MRNAVTMLAVLVLAACGNRPGAGGDTSADAGPTRDASVSDAGAADASTSPDAGTGGTLTCAFERSNATGRLCAFQPSTIDSRVSDEFGWHAVGIPTTVTAQTRIYVHLVGSGGQPVNPANGNVPNLTLIQEAVERGFLVVMPAYDNEPAVGGLCGQDLDCFEPVRREILYGEAAAGEYADLKDVQVPNDIRSRTSMLLRALKDGGFLGATPPAALAGDDVDVAQLWLGGHSQGGGHVALWARDHLVARVCMLSAPVDAATQPSLQPAPWVGGSWVTPLGARRAVVHEDDPVFDRVNANLDAMGLVEDTHWRRLTEATNDPHAETAKGTAAASSSARVWACWE
ncbi:MAG: hypothetical protein AB2A00_08865 [Myxococcota bacterium]